MDGQELIANPQCLVVQDQITKDVLMEEAPMEAMEHVLVLALLATEEFTVRSDSLVPAQTFIARMVVPLQVTLAIADAFVLSDI